MLVGQQFPAMHGLHTVLPVLDWETYSEAGFRWVDVSGYTKQLKHKTVWVPPTVKLASLEGFADSDRGLSTVGVYNYVTHPTFEVLSLAYDLKDGFGKRFWKPGRPEPIELTQHARQQGLLKSWNFGFEWYVWNLYCAPKWGWPPLNENQVRCVMAESALAGFPRSLKNAGKVLNLQNQKDPEGEALIRKLTVPKNPTKANPALRWTEATAPLDFQKFYAYNVQDIVAEDEASSRIPDLPPRELEIWRVDQRINRRGVQLDTKAMADCIAIVEQCTQKYWAQLRDVTGGRVETHSEVAETLNWLRDQSVYLDNLDQDTVDEQLKLVHSPGVHQVLKIRQLLSYGSVKKLYAMRAQVCADGRLREQYAFSAAHTHLWNGQDVQLANVYKGKLDKPEKVEQALACIASRSLDYVEGIYGNALECVADCLRSIPIAAPGHRLITTDFNAIQAVITAALAGEKWILDVFHTHGKIYEAMASQLTGRPLQFYLDWKNQTGAHHPERQTHGKIPTLASYFGAWIGGWKRFGAEELGTDEDIKQMILEVRAKIPRVAELWGGQTRDKFTNQERPELYGLEGAAISAVKDRGVCYGYRGIRFITYNDILYCAVPGDHSPLVYHAPKLARSTRSYASPWELELTYKGWNSNPKKGPKGWIDMKLYGGVLTQNVVAKTAREYQADALVTLECEGYPVVMHTHDEQGTEVPFGVGSPEGQLEIVNRKKPWAIDDWGRPWPVKCADADETLRGGKWEVKGGARL